MFEQLRKVNIGENSLPKVYFQIRFVPPLISARSCKIVRSKTKEKQISHKLGSLTQLSKVAFICKIESSISVHKSPRGKLSSFEEEGKSSERPFLEVLQLREFFLLNGGVRGESPLDKSQVHLRGALKCMEQRQFSSCNSCVRKSR